MKRKSIIILTCAVLCFSSCGKIHFGDTESQYRTFLTGECLSGTELSLARCEVINGGRPTDTDRIVFWFSMPLSNYAEESVDHSTIFASKRFRNIPSADAFKDFGKHQQSVKNGFEDVYKDFSDAYTARGHGYGYSIITILYNGGLSLTADKEFAGRPAGENLADLISCHPMYDGLLDAGCKDQVLAPASAVYPLEVLGLPLDYFSMLDGVQTLPFVSFSIPVGDYDRVDLPVSKPITFELNIPVKVVKYLTWINDKLSDPNAPVPYEDEVLHCTFSTRYDLR